MTEMAHTLISLETELKYIKREIEIKDNSDKEEVTKPNIGDNKGGSKTNDVVTKERKVTKDTGDSDPNDNNGSFFLQCNLCDLKCIKDSLHKKHVKAKHQEYKCDLCDKKVSNLIKLLQHKTKDHSKQEQVEMRDIKLQDYRKAIQENEVGKTVGDGEFKCSKCDRIMSINDTLDKHNTNNKKTCKHCAILQYDKKLKVGPS